MNSDTTIEFSNQKIIEFLATYSNKYSDRYDHIIKDFHYCFFTWSKKSEKLLINDPIDWNEIFDDKPYFFFTPDVNGYLFPKFPIIDNKPSFQKSRFEDYITYISNIGLRQTDNNSAISKISNINQLSIFTKDSIDLAVTGLVNIDDNIKDALKVFYFDGRQVIKRKRVKKAEKDKQFTTFKNYVIDLYSNYVMMKRYAEFSLETMINKGKGFVNSDIHKSLANALSYYMQEKQKIIDFIKPVFNNYTHIATARYYLLKGEPLFDHTHNPLRLPGTDPSVQDFCIRIATQGLKNTDSAKFFLQMLIDSKADKPNLKLSKYIGHIREIKDKDKVLENFSNNALRSWEKKYEEAFRLYSGIQNASK